MHVQLNLLNLDVNVNFLSWVVDAVVGPNDVNDGGMPLSLCPVSMLFSPIYLKIHNMFQF